ncbi:YceH family protein [Paludibacterium yongneupense]|uniref:YceH family protein n=1 Tax=Paludibacterium yongneupense TaxID=400061 RepID=UPI0004003ADD|nr:YceH family protein [Paludibacterium yongneupense]
MDTYEFSPAEVRVLGVLVEKQALTPDAYPMTLNAIINACNQLTSREPVLQLDEPDVVAAIDALSARRLIAERQPSGSRVVKYEHRLPYEWNIEGARSATLALLMLRGAQTAAEIRARSGRLYPFSSVAEVENALQQLADKYPPLVQLMERQPGAREARWAHLLYGEAQIAATAPAAESGLAARVSSLEAEVEALKARIAELESR